LHRRAGSGEKFVKEAGLAVSGADAAKARLHRLETALRASDFPGPGREILPKRGAGELANEPRGRVVERRAVKIQRRAFPNRVRAEQTRVESQMQVSRRRNHDAAAGRPHRRAPERNVRRIVRRSHARELGWLRLGLRPDASFERERSNKKKEAGQAMTIQS